MDPTGKLVIIELKRDDSGADPTGRRKLFPKDQRYEEIVKHSCESMMVRLATKQRTNCSGTLTKMILSSLNNDQRIILASHRFAPEVTSAALWLNGKSPNLITCVQLTPYVDGESMYVHASTLSSLCPARKTTWYRLASRLDEGGGSSSSLGIKLTETFRRNRSDHVTSFPAQCSPSCNERDSRRKSVPDTGIADGPEIREIGAITTSGMLSPRGNWRCVLYG